MQNEIVKGLMILSCFPVIGITLGLIVRFAEKIFVDKFGKVW